MRIRLGVGENEFVDVCSEWHHICPSVRSTGRAWIRTPCPHECLAFPKNFGRGMRLGIRAAGSARTVGPSGLCGLNPVAPTPRHSRLLSRPRVLGKAKHEWGRGRGWGLAKTLRSKRCDGIRASPPNPAEEAKNVAREVVRCPEEREVEDQGPLAHAGRLRSQTASARRRSHPPRRLEGLAAEHENELVDRVQLARS